MVRAALANDRKAQKALFDLFNAKLYATACYHMNDEEEAKEVLQQAWVDIFKSLHNYKEQAALGGWMKTIILRKIWKHHKSRSAIVELKSEHKLTADDSSARLLQRISCKEILDEMEAIPPQARKVFKLYVLDELSHGEIAALMSISESASRSHLTKARKIMKERYYSINKMASNGL